MLSGTSLRAGLVTRPQSPTVCDMSECDRETSTMRRSRFTRGCCAIVKTLTDNFQLQQASQVQSKARPRSPYFSILDTSLGSSAAKILCETGGSLGVEYLKYCLLACEAV